MLSQTLFFITLLASFVSADAAGYTLNVPKAVQCADTTLTWTAPAGATGDVTIYVFTGCSDSNDDPIATIDNASGASATWYVNSWSGQDLFWALVDSDGNEYYSDDFGVGGNAGADAQTCQTHLKSANLLTVTIDASVSGTPPTTLAPSASLDPVANAAQTATTPGNGVIGNNGGAIGTSGASGKMTVSPSTSIALGLIGAALLAVF